jgi:hypothetical protein
MIEINKTIRLNEIIDKAWEIIFESIVSKRLIINKESSLQLHFSKLIFELGNIYCVLPDEIFKIEMETNYEKKNIDIVCKLFDNSSCISAAIELKCFIKKSNRAKDIDGYDALKDIEKLQNYNDFAIKKFYCLTDNKYYSETEQKGHGKAVTIKEGTFYVKNSPIFPTWDWKIKRDKPIEYNQDIKINWLNKNGWYVLIVNVK